MCIVYIYNMIKKNIIPELACQLKIMLFIKKYLDLFVSFGRKTTNYSSMYSLFRLCFFL